MENASLYTLYKFYILRISICYCSARLSLLCHCSSATVIQPLSHHRPQMLRLCTVFLVYDYHYDPFLTFKNKDILLNHSSLHSSPRLFYPCRFMRTENNLLLHSLTQSVIGSYGYKL